MSNMIHKAPFTYSESKAESLQFTQVTLVLESPVYKFGVKTVTFLLEFLIGFGSI